MISMITNCELQLEPAFYKASDLTFDRCVRPSSIELKEISMMVTYVQVKFFLFHDQVFHGMRHYEYQ